MRRSVVALVVVLGGCGGGRDLPATRTGSGSATAARADAGAPAAATNDATAALPASIAYPDLAAALIATIPGDARVVGFGELHARVDRARVPSALSRFTAALSAFADRVSDLVVETWLVDPQCGSGATDATARVEAAVKRPAETKSELAALGDAARAKGIRPLAMQLSCDDYARIAPPGKDVDYEAMLALVTRELSRLVRGAVAKPASARPLIAVYGGALHNDRFPEPGTEDWSYAATVDAATGGRFVEVDLIVPELAIGDPGSARQPWYPLATAADTRVRVWKRGERSFVVVLPTSAVGSGAS